MRLLRTFSIYTIVGFLNAGIGFLMLPVLTRYLSPSDYGIVALCTAFASILIPIIGLSASGLLTVEYHNPRVNKDQFKRLFSSVRLIPLLTILPLTVIFLIVLPAVASFFEIPRIAYWFVLPIALFGLYQENFLSFLIATKRAKLYSLVAISKVVFEISLTLCLVVLFKKSWDGRLLSALITAILFTFVSIFLYKKWDLISLNVSKAYLYQAILFGSPLILHQIGKFVINQSDRLFLAKMVSLEEMGIYSVGYQVGMIISIIVAAFTSFFSPFLFERLNKGTQEAKFEIIKISYLFVVAIFICLFILTVVSPWILEHLIDESYLGAGKYIFWVGLSYVFWGIYILFTGYMQFLKKTKILGYIAILNIILNIVFNFFFIGFFGAIGAAYATCLSYFIIMVLVALSANKLFPMPWVAYLKAISSKNA